MSAVQGLAWKHFPESLSDTLTVISSGQFDGRLKLVQLCVFYIELLLFLFTSPIRDGMSPLLLLNFLGKFCLDFRKSKVPKFNSWWNEWG